MARPVHLLMFRRRKQSIAQWAEEFGIPENTLYCRIFRLGWSMKDALTTPVRAKHKA